jgi:predicted dehydrogenase
MCLDQAKSPVSPPASQETAMNDQPVRIVLIGTGGIGTYHLQQWAEVPGAAVVGLFDADPERGRTEAERHGVAKVYDSLEAAVAEPRADAIDVCIPNAFHREAVVAALGAGKHCICEKPLAVTPAEIEAMIAARDRSGRLLMTAQHMRFEQSALALKRVVDAGRLGQPYYSRAWWLRRRMAPTTPGFLSRAQAGHGPGLDLGVHMLDLALHLLGQPEPVRVSGLSFRKIADQPDVANQWGPFRAADYEVEDFAGGLVRFADGSALSLEVSWLLNMIEPERYGVWLHGTRGGMQWPDLKIAHVQDGLLVDSEIISERGGHGHRNELAAFADAIRTGGPSPVPAEQSLTVARVLTALYASAEAGQEVAL